MDRRLALPLLAACLLTAAAIAQSPPAAEKHPDASIDATLTAMEAASKDIRTLKASVVYMTEETKLGTKKIRLHKPAENEAAANVFIVRPPAGSNRSAQFRVDFNVLFADGKSWREVERYHFDGNDLYHRKDAVETVTIERIVQRGETLDVFSLSGPFPLPFGQDKAEMMKAFTITAQNGDAANDVGVPKFVKKPIVLKLIPREGTRLADSVRHISMVVDGTTHLPAKVVSHEQTDLVKTAIFKDVQINQPLREADLKLDWPATFKVADNREAPMPKRE